MFSSICAGCFKGLAIRLSGSFHERSRVYCAGVPRFPNLLRGSFAQRAQVRNVPEITDEEPEGPACLNTIFSRVLFCIMYVSSLGCIQHIATMSQGVTLKLLGLVIAET